MAKVTTARTETTFVLELSTVEAQYVEAALRRANPTRLPGDPVWDALEEAMTEAGVDFDVDALSRA